MRFYEYESKAILSEYGIAVPASEFCKTAEEVRSAVIGINRPVALKSQVLSGGRMKAGGIKFAESADEAAAAAIDIFALSINGNKPVGILVEEQMDVEQEYYAAVTYDGRAKKPLVIFSDMGGIDIEQVAEEHPEHLSRTHFSAMGRFPDYVAKNSVAVVGIA